MDSTVGLPKAEVVARRLLDINPYLDLVALNEFLDPAKAEALVAGGRGGAVGAGEAERMTEGRTLPYDYVVDCIGEGGGRI